MKYHFYVDNFRGFSNTYIPLSDVNFFVGENSTGKTSVLSLIKLVSAQKFLLNPEFGDEHVNFGHFSDMVSAHSDDRSYFSIGAISEEEPSNKQIGVVTGCLLTFMEEQGLPRLASLTFCRGTEKVAIRFRGNTVYYKRESYKTAPTAQKIMSTLLPHWRDEQQDAIAGYTKLGAPSVFSGRIPVLFLLSMILSEPRQPKSDKPSSEVTFFLQPTAFPPEIIWIAPIRTKPSRTYDELTLDFSPEGGHTPYLIRKLLRSKTGASKFHAFINKIGKASGLFQDVQIKNFGRGVTAPFEVDVVLDGKALNLSTVGYGVSQALPVLVEMLARSHATWFAIQQPEVHLHPRAQAALGDLFFELAVNEHKSFLIETHSDFTIDRFRMNYKRKGSKKPDSQILFFERRNNRNTVTPLSIGKSGDLPADQPDSYRQFFIREEMRLLGI